MTRRRRRWWTRSSRLLRNARRASTDSVTSDKHPAATGSELTSKPRFTGDAADSRNRSSSSFLTVDELLCIRFLFLRRIFALLFFFFFLIYLLFLFLGVRHLYSKAGRVLSRDTRGTPDHLRPLTPSSVYSPSSAYPCVMARSHAGRGKEK